MVDAGLHVSIDRERVLADADRAGLVDGASRVAPRDDETLPDFVQAFASKILRAKRP